MVTKREILQVTSFGERIAEQEISELNSYFVETDQWQRVYAGDVDIIYGPKGSGKSAIYSLLQNREKDLRIKRIIVIAAENPRGTPAFNDLVSDPPTSENEFVGLWKLYLLSLIAEKFKIYGISDDASKVVIRELEKAKLLAEESGLRGKLRAALDYARSVVKAESVEGGIKIDPHSGLPVGVTGKITFREPNASQREKGLISADSLLELANKALEASSYKIWLLLDRLDVAFAESHDLEKNALRALFKVYLGIQGLDNISLKIFLRSDIWRRITESGFREASHITRYITIKWDKQSLMNLIVRRLLNNKPIQEYYNINVTDVLADVNRQEDFYYHVFPDKVDPGAKQPTTLDWMLTRTKDATDTMPAPRELIHLLSAARNTQLRKLEVGHDEPEGTVLIGRAALKDALPEVSQTRLEQTLYAEYPEYKKYLQKLEGEKTSQTSSSLAKLWHIPEADAQKYASDLAEIGLFEVRGPKEQVIYWVPFLYRDALKLVQGSAE